MVGSRDAAFYGVIHRKAGKLRTTSSTMNTTTNPFTTEYRGGALGTRFVDCPPSGDLASSTINKMIIRHDPSCVFHLQVLISSTVRLDINFPIDLYYF